MSGMRKIDEIDEKFKITIGNGVNSVSAPLPEDFGFTVGSEYSTPFDLGTVTGAWHKGFALAGISSPVGFRMRKMYTNPEPTEISFRMSFDAYYDAISEVAIPVITLVKMGLGRVLTSEAIEQKLSELYEVIPDLFKPTPTVSPDLPNTPIGGATPYKTDRVLELIKMINAPDLCTLQFGTFITMDSVFITSTAVTFSNNLDSRGIPMSAEVNVTCTLQIAPIAEDVIGFFGDYA